MFDRADYPVDAGSAAHRLIRSGRIVHGGNALEHESDEPSLPSSCALLAPAEDKSAEHLCAEPRIDVRAVHFAFSQVDAESAADSIEAHPLVVQLPGRERHRAHSLLSGDAFMRHLVRDPSFVAHYLFGPARDPDLEADAAFLQGELAPPNVPAPPPAAETETDAPSPLFDPSSREEIESDGPADYNPSVAAALIRKHTVRGRPRPPRDPLKTRFVVIDVETTALGESDRIVELAAIELVGPVATGRRFHALVDPRRTISDGAYDIHGISDDMVRGRPSFATIANKLIKFIGSTETWLVAHQADFDIGFLNAEFERAGKTFRFSGNRTICTLKMAASRVGHRALDNVCDRLGIDRKSRVKHRAELDAELCAEVFRRLVFGGRPTVAKADAEIEVLTGGVSDVSRPSEAAKT